MEFGLNLAAFRDNGEAGSDPGSVELGGSLDIDSIGGDTSDEEPSAEPREESDSPARQPGSQLLLPKDVRGAILAKRSQGASRSADT